mmetsp:Transcript_14197/g.11868  ORF Transcript_14197/g.11868 Transcript_14197/m.11868 type:complete len:161 (-) Transcript_14197:135-617(-)
MCTNNRYINKVYTLYMNTFNEVMSLSNNITTYEDCYKLKDILKSQSINGRDVIKWIQMGHKELMYYEGLDEMNEFIDKLFIMRIGTRLLIDHYIALHNSIFISGISSSSNINTSSNDNNVILLLLCSIFSFLIFSIEALKLFFNISCVINAICSGIYNIS